MKQQQQKKAKKKKRESREREKKQTHVVVVRTLNFMFNYVMTTPHFFFSLYLN